ncbi:MAG: hypothetical protein RDV41_01420, partial [Planctomycetota bacterium]|nr:hypothetical protein [Planctomycetota bacterium]
MKAEESLLFGQIAIKKGLIAPQQLQDCLQTQSALAQRGIKRLIGEITIEKGLLTNAQVSVILSLQLKMRAHAADMAFGDGAVAGGYVTAMQLKECLSLIENVRKNKPGADLSLAEVMVNKGLLTAAQRGLIEGAAGGHASKTAPVSSGSTADAAYIPGLHAHHALEGATCQYCKSVIRAEHAVQICGGCKGTYHAECWVAAGGCSDTKCEEYAGEGGEPQARAVAKTPGNLAAVGLKLGIVVLAVAAVVGGVMLMGKSADDCYMEAKKIDESISGTKNVEDRTWGVLDYQRAALGVEEFSGKGVGGVERTRKREQQLDWLRKAIEKDPQHLDAWFDMGVVHLEFKKLDEAYKDFKKVVEIDPKHSRAHIMLGAILEQDKDYKGAE